VSAPRIIPAIGGTRSRRTIVRRLPSHSRGQESDRSPAEVLYWPPFQGLRGTPLQFQSFDGPYVERLRAGDARTEQHFVDYFSGLIQIKLRSRLRSREAIEDVRQETFTRVLIALRDGKILHPERLGPYVNAICTNVLLEHYRAGSHDNCSDDAEQMEILDKSADLFAAFSSKQTGDKVRQVLERLSERDRRLLREVFLEERDKDDVCRDFGVDRDYLRVLLHRAKQSFKSLYSNDLEHDPPEAATA